MKNRLYGIFDTITMVFSPLIEDLFDYAEVLSARRGARKIRGRVQTASDATALEDARVTGIRRRESFGW
ncbi:MAG: hypothetical protein H0T92_08920 [Pyrinomonadaceae bacterium]|nr:hypothetical protein [Pyrinomonadaceae bacterium]